MRAGTQFLGSVVGALLLCSCGGSGKSGAASPPSGATVSPPSTSSGSGAALGAPPGSGAALPLPATAPGTNATTPESPPSPTGGAPVPGASSAPPASAVPAPPSPADLSRIRKEVEATVAARPKEFSIRMEAATFYMRTGDHAAAVTHLQAAARLSPRESLPWIAIGDAETLRRRFLQAETAYRKAAALDPYNALLARGRGQLLLSQQRFSEARTIMEEGLKRHPDDLELRVSLGNLYLVVARPRLAVQTLEPAVKQLPDNLELHRLLAEAYERDLHLEAAIRELREVTRLDPTAHLAWGHIGLYLGNLSRYAEARPPLERAIALSPGESYYYGTLANSYLLDTSRPEHFARANELFRKALLLNPRNDRALYAYALGLTRLGQQEHLTEAVRLLDRFLLLKKHDPRAHFKLAETYRRLGKPREAARHLALFQKLSDRERAETRRLVAEASFVDTAEAHVRLGREHLKRDDPARAEREFQLALERDPEQVGALQGLRQAQAGRAAPGGGGPR